MSYVMRQVRKHPDLAPVVFFTILGAAFATAAGVRACMVYTDVSFRRKSNPHPWLHVKPDQQTKFMTATSLKGLKNNRPDFEKED